MERRHLVTALALVFAPAAITPTLGAQSQTQSVLAKSGFPVRTAKAAKLIAKKAKKFAKQAKTTAADAQATAGEAAQNATEAKNTANQAIVTADATAAELAALRSRTDTDVGTVTTAEENAFVDLGGPSVNLTVPASGLIEVWAQVTISDGVVSLFENGQQVPGQDPNDACSALSDGLLSVQGVPGFTTSTPGSFGFTGCGGLGAPGPVLFKTSPGQHTYDLRYADCGCDPTDAEFVDRTLTVAPRP